MLIRLKRRFIALAMISLAVLMLVVVAGMNIINYNAVVREADTTLEILSRNRGRLPVMRDGRINYMFGDKAPGAPGGGSGMYGSGSGAWKDGSDSGAASDTGADGLGSEAWKDGTGSGAGDGIRTGGARNVTSEEYDDVDAGTREGSGPVQRLFGRGGMASGLSMDEAEETRYFTVLLDCDGEAVRTYTDRIYSVDEDTAETYAEEASASGNTSGFMENFRYTVSEEGEMTRVTFLDCSRALESFKRFLYISIAMSLAGLLIMFGVICYFAGRIVRPVAESYEKQKRFITDAGHEIKTPLTIIKANIDVMRMDIEDAGGAADNGIEFDSVRRLAESLNESLEDIDGQVDRLTGLTNDLVYLSRMEEGPSTLTMTEIPFSDIVSETADSFSAVAVERKKALDISVQPMISVNGSTKEIEKLVTILVENALKYSPEGDTIGVSLKREGRNAVFEVRNRTEEELSDEDLSHVFDRFYRADKSRSAGGGHGIGLSMASAITAAHGGRIRAGRGDGSEFVVTASVPACN